MANTDYLNQSGKIKPFKMPYVDGKQIQMGNATSLKKKMLANPSVGYGQQAARLGNNIAGMPAKTGDLIFRGVDAVRNTFNRPSNGMKLGNAPQVNTKADAQNALSQTFTGIAGVGDKLGQLRQGAIDTTSKAMTSLFGDNQQQQPVYDTTAVQAGIDANNQVDPRIIEQGQQNLANIQQSADLNEQAYSSQFNRENKVGRGITSYRQATPEAVPSRIGVNGQVEFTNPDGSGSGTMDFGSPEENAIMQAKILANRGTVSTLNTGYAGQQPTARQQGNGQMGQLIQQAMRTPNSANQSFGQMARTKGESRRAMRILGMIQGKQNKQASLGQQQNQFEANQARMGADAEYRQGKDRRDEAFRKSQQELEVAKINQPKVSYKLDADGNIKEVSKKALELQNQETQINKLVTVAYAKATSEEKKQLEELYPQLFR